MGGVNDVILLLEDKHSFSYIFHLPLMGGNQ